MIKDKALSAFRFVKANALWLVGAIAIVALFALIWYVPKYQTRVARELVNVAIADLAAADQAKERLQLEKDLITSENSARTTIAQIIGGFVVLLGLYFTYQNVKTAQQNILIAQQNLRVTEDGKLTDRFSKAVELLGNSNLNVRLGGIYALERIARDSKHDHWTIMEILTAYVREHSSVTNTEVEGEKVKNVPADIQAIADVIGRRKWVDSEKDNQRINLNSTYLANVSLEGVEFKNANLFWAILTGGISQERKP